MVYIVRINIPPSLNLALGHYIVVSIQDRDIMEKLILEHIEKITDFEWKAEIRYCFLSPEEDKEKEGKLCPITISTTTTTLNYCFEYLGNMTRLVITQLTDRCFRALFLAYNVKCGCAPNNPVGTRKTEFVKYLSKCVGVM